MRRSQVSVPVFVLNTVRSAELGPSAPVNQITITPASPWIVLSLELEADPEIRSYRASLLNAEKRLIWRGVNLKPNPKDGLAVSINASLLKAGDYLVSLEGRTQSGRYLSVAKYPLRVIKKSSDK